MREELQANTQIVAQLLGEIEANLGKFEAPALRRGQVIVVVALDEPLANEAVNLNRRWVDIGRFFGCRCPANEQR
jgi:hypothetical protein